MFALGRLDPIAFGTKFAPWILTGNRQSEWHGGMAMGVKRDRMWASEVQGCRYF